jgi:hypothetical protein
MADGRDVVATYRDPLEIGAARARRKSAEAR